MLLNSIDPFRSMALISHEKHLKAIEEQREVQQTWNVILEFYREIQIIILTKQGSNLFFPAQIYYYYFKIVSRVKKREKCHLALAELLYFQGYRLHVYF